MKTGAFGRWRLAAQVALCAAWFIAPWLTFGGRRLVGLDLEAGELRLFGAGIPASDLFTALLAVLSLLFLLLWITAALGRLWCGWLCPQSIFSDLADFSGGKKRNRPRLLATALAFSLASGATLALYIFPPEQFFSAALILKPGAPLLIFSVTSAFLFLNMVLVGRKFCLSVCPYGKILTILTDRDAVEVVRFQEKVGNCIECGACERICPMGLDVRVGAGPDCIRCARCADACEKVLAKRGGTIVGFSLPGGGWLKGVLARPKHLPLLVLALALATAFAWRAATEREAAFSVRTTPEVSARRMVDGRSAIFLTARISAKPGEYSIAAGGAAELKGDIDHIVIGQGRAAAVKFALVTSEKSGRVPLLLKDSGGRELAAFELDLARALEAR